MEIVTPPADCVRYFMDIEEGENAEPPELGGSMPALRGPSTEQKTRDRRSKAPALCSMTTWTRDVAT